jgi:hypothetical protein
VNQALLQAMSTELQLVQPYRVGSRRRRAAAAALNLRRCQCALRRLLLLVDYRHGALAEVHPEVWPRGRSLCARGGGGWFESGEEQERSAREGRRGREGGGDVSVSEWDESEEKLEGEDNALVPSLSFSLVFIFAPSTRAPVSPRLRLFAAGSCRGHEGRERSPAWSWTLTPEQPSRSSSSQCVQRAGEEWGVSKKSGRKKGKLFSDRPILIGGFWISFCAVFSFFSPRRARTWSHIVVKLAWLKGY